MLQDASLSIRLRLCRYSLILPAAACIRHRSGTRLLTASNVPAPVLGTHGHFPRRLSHKSTVHSMDGGLRKSNRFLFFGAQGHLSFRICFCNVSNCVNLHEGDCYRANSPWDQSASTMDSSTSQSDRRIVFSLPSGRERRMPVRFCSSPLGCYPALPRITTR